MPTFKITDPVTGKTVRLTGDSAPSEEELNQIFSQLHGEVAPSESGVAKKVWDALSVPEQMSRQGLKQLAEFIPEGAPQGNAGMVEKATLAALSPYLRESVTPSPGVMTDVLRGAPRIAADTLAEAAPGFISRGALVTAGASRATGAAAPAAKAVLRSIGKQGESVSGVVPGALEAAYKDSSLMGAAGKKAVSEMYERAKSASGPMREALKKIPSENQFVDSALELANKGKLNPIEALEARKELVKIKKSVTDSYFRYAKDKLDAVAKQAFGAADEAYKRANMAESLRNIAPQNKYGGASAFKMMLMKLASDEGLTGKALSLAMSPAAQGAAATGAGVAGRNVLAPLAAVRTLSRETENAMALSAALAKKKQMEILNGQ